MKKIAINSLLFVMLILAGCPAATDNPIDTGSYTVPSWLLGEWITESGPALTKEHLVFEKGSKKTELKCYEIDSLGKKNLVYDPVIFSSVGGKVFLSAHEPNGKYWLMQMVKTTEAAFEIIELDETILEGGIKEDASSAQIKAFLVKNLSNDEIFGGTSYYKKKQ